MSDKITPCITPLAKKLKDRADNALGWMEGADFEDFYRYEGMFIGYMEAWNEVRKLIPEEQARVERKNREADFDLDEEI